MTDKDKIKSEIESRISNIEYSAISSPQREGAKLALNSMLDFINSLPEEPVSEDLEKTSYRFACKCNPLKTEWSTTSPNPEVIEAFKAGAKWQEKKDQETIELAEDHAMLAGMEKMKEQMMKDAIPANILTNQYGNKYIQSWSGLKQYDKYKNGDKVKLIIIKEE